MFDRIPSTHEFHKMYLFLDTIVAERDICWKSEILTRMMLINGVKETFHHPKVEWWNKIAHDTATTTDLSKSSSLTWIIRQRMSKTCFLSKTDSLNISQDPYLTQRWAKVRRNDFWELGDSLHYGKDGTKDFCFPITKRHTYTHTCNSGALYQFTIIHRQWMLTEWAS